MSDTIEPHSDGFADGTAPPSGRANKWLLVTTIVSGGVAIAAIAFAIGLAVNGNEGEQISAEQSITTTAPTTTTAAPTTTTTTTTSTTTSTTTTTAPPTTTSPPAPTTTIPPVPSGLQEWADEYARYRERMRAADVDAESENPCAERAAVVEEFSGALSGAPTPAVAAAYQALLAEERFVYSRCLQVSLYEAEAQAVWLRDLHNAVVTAIIYDGATYSGR